MSRFFQCCRSGLCFYITCLRTELLKRPYSYSVYQGNDYSTNSLTLVKDGEEMVNQFAKGSFVKCFFGFLFVKLLVFLTKTLNFGSRLGFV